MLSLLVNLLNTTLALPAAMRSEKRQKKLQDICREVPWYDQEASSLQGIR